MADIIASKNRLAARILKAEMLGDEEMVETLKLQLANIEQGSLSSSKVEDDKQSPNTNKKKEPEKSQTINKNTSGQLKRVHEDDMTIQQMYIQEKTGSAKDDVKLYLNNQKKFARDSLDTSQFSEEKDDSQAILKGATSKSKQRGEILRGTNKNKEHEPCDICPQTKLKHLILWQGQHVFMSLLPFRLSLSRLSCTVIRNLDHDYDCFVDSSEECQSETEHIISCLKSCWDKQGYQCIVMESYHKNSRNSNRNLLPNSGDNHFQLYCIAIKKRYFEEARLYFKQALLECEKEWSMNKKLITTSDDKRIHNCLPRGLSYFWVCFDSINKGFAHVIEDEDRFSNYFGFDVLAGLLDKNLHEVLHPKKEDYLQQFERSRLFKLEWSQYKPAGQLND